MLFTIGSNFKKVGRKKNKTKQKKRNKTETKHIDRLISAVPEVLLKVQRVQTHQSNDIEAFSKVHMILLWAIVHILLLPFVVQPLGSRVPPAEGCKSLPKYQHTQHSKSLVSQISLPASSFLASLNRHILVNIAATLHRSVRRSRTTQHKMRNRKQRASINTCPLYLPATRYLRELLPQVADKAVFFQRQKGQPPQPTEFERSFRQCLASQNIALLTQTHT